MRKCYVFFLASASAFLFTTGLKFTRITSFVQKVKTSIKNANWIKVFSKIDHSLSTLNTVRKRIKFDISAGYSSISSSEEAPPDVSYLLVDIMDDNQGPKSPLLWAHQVGKRVVRKVPDTALLGVLVLIASELLRRGVESNSDTLPPVVREFANATIAELDAKLERLSSLDWKIDPFLRAELENLQTQPLEVIDKFIVSSILPSVDKEFAPFLLKYMVGDTKRVKTITQSLKDLIQLSTVLLEGTITGTGTRSVPGPTALDRTTSTIIEQVDLVGQSIEEVVNDWNRIVVQFTGSITEYLHTDSVLNLLNKQFLLKDGSNSTAAVNDTDIPNSINVNKIAQRTLLWNSKRPFSIDTTVDFIDIDHRNGEKGKSMSRITGAGGRVGGESTGSFPGDDKNNFYYEAHDKHGKSPVSGNFAAEEVSWASLLKASRNKNNEKPNIATTLLNNITKKPAKPSNLEGGNGVKKTPPSSTPSAFTSYLQDLMD